MAIKSYAEMRKIDVLPYCDFREAKDDKGKKLQVPYLNWAKCKELLHENGANVVYFEPCTNANGSSLFMSDQVFTDKNGVTNRCYEVRVRIVIDDLKFEAQFPLMNGSNPVKDNSMTQQRLWNAQTRAFVKGVAMVTGLGFGLWVTDDEAGDKSPIEDLSSHSIYAIRERMQQQYTKLVKRGLSTGEIAKMMGTSEQTVQYYLNGIFDEINRFEKALGEI